METNLQNYVAQQLSAAGFVIVAPAIAFEQRADLWGFNRANCGNAFNISRADRVRYLRQQARVSVMEVQLNDGEWMLFAFRASNPPLAYVELILGQRVTGVRPLAEPKPAPVAKVEFDDGPPAHQCQARSEYFAARGIPDPVYRAPSRFAHQQRKRF